MLAIGTYALYCGMKKITALFMAATGIACAQTYNYDAANETLVIKGKGNSVADLNITSSVGSLEIGAATGDISATDVSNGLNVGDVGNVNVSGTNVNVHDGKTVSGNIVSTTDFTLTNGGSARAEATTSPNSGASMPTTPRRFRAKSTTT